MLLRAAHDHSMPGQSVLDDQEARQRVGHRCQTLIPADHGLLKAVLTSHRSKTSLVRLERETAA